MMMKSDFNFNGERTRFANLVMYVTCDYTRSGAWLSEVREANSGAVPIPLRVASCARSHRGIYRGCDRP